MASAQERREVSNMDPDANLKEQLELTTYIVEMSEPTDTDDLLRLEDKARRLAELVLALHGWMQTGGFIPKLWAEHRKKEGV